MSFLLKVEFFRLKFFFSKRPKICWPLKYVAMPYLQHPTDVDMSATHRVDEVCCCVSAQQKAWLLKFRPRLPLVSDGPCPAIFSRRHLSKLIIFWIVFVVAYLKSSSSFQLKLNGVKDWLFHWTNLSNQTNRALLTIWHKNQLLPCTDFSFSTGSPFSSNDCVGGDFAPDTWLADNPFEPESFCTSIVNTDQWVFNNDQ